MSDATNNIEMALLTRVIYEKNFQALEKAQITEEFFMTPIGQEVYRFMRGMYHAPETVGQVPSLEFIQMRFPNSFYPFPSNDGVPVLAAELRRQKIRIETLLLAQTVSELADRDPMAAMAALKAEVSKLASLAEVGQDMTLAGSFQHLLNTYEIVQSSQGVIGIPFPWAPLNEETQGMQGGQFIVLYARPKRMKSWLALYVAMFAYVFCRRKVMVYSREMSPKLVMQRAAALFCGVDYKAYKNGKLQPHKKQEVFDKLRDMIEDEKMEARNGHQPFFKVVSDTGGSGGGGGVSWLHAKVKEAKPDLLIVDGMYLMKDDRTASRASDWKNITHISQDLKLLAQAEDIPLFGVTQANRDSEKGGKDQQLSGIGYSDGFAQDADVALHVDLKDKIDPNTKKEFTELYLTAPGLREGKFHGMVLYGEPATNFGFKRILTSADFEGGGNDGGQKRSTFQRPAADPNVPTRGRFGG